MGATQKVQKFIDGEVLEVLEASEMNKEIQQVTEKRFDLAHSTAITRSSLQRLVGYCAGYNLCARPSERIFGHPS